MLVSLKKHQGNGPPWRHLFTWNKKQLDVDFLLTCDQAFFWLFFYREGGYDCRLIPCQPWQQDAHFTEEEWNIHFKKLLRLGFCLLMLEVQNTANHADLKWKFLPKLIATCWPSSFGLPLSITWVQFLLFKYTAIYQATKAMTAGNALQMLATTCLELSSFLHIYGLFIRLFCLLTQCYRCLTA